MEHIKFEQLNPTNEMHCACFRKMMRAYAKEQGGLEAFVGNEDEGAIIEKWISSILRQLGPSDRHLELCWLDETLAGMMYGKVDHLEHRGFIKPGYGYVMEFYVVPELRRKGIGTEMYHHLEKCFAADGAKQVYLTTDTDCGISFWEHLGFVNSHEKSPDNQMDIYEKWVE